MIKANLSKNTPSIPETEEQIQQSIARALLGIIAISIFIIFFLGPYFR